MKLAYWPGCVSRGFTPELHGSMELVAPKLDLELVELDRANCSGAGVIAEHNQELADTLNARTFAMAQDVEGAAGMMNICSTCQGAQSECQERLDADSSDYRSTVNEHLSRRGPAPTRRAPSGGTRTSSGCWSRRSGWRSWPSKVVRPLEGLRIAPFYGCYIVRPTERLGYAEYPNRDKYLDILIEVLGAEPVEYAGSHKCCGFPVITMNRTTSLRQAGRHLADAIDAGADCLVTPCPLCHLNLDMQQPEAAKFVERDLDVPVLHLPAAGRPGPGAGAQGAGHEPPRGQDQGRAAQDRRARCRLAPRSGPGNEKTGHPAGRFSLRRAYPIPPYKTLSGTIVYHDLRVPALPLPEGSWGERRGERCTGCLPLCLPLRLPPCPAT